MIKNSCLILGIVATALCVPAAAFAQKVILTAEINAAQEVPGTASAARGEAVMKYDMDTNMFELEVRLGNFAETLTASHIHEADAGANGPALVSLGGDEAYKHSGDRLRLKVKKQAYTGSAAMLLTGGAYLNFHTPNFPGGAVRGQLLPHSADFIANLKPIGATKAGGPRARGVAKVRYDFIDDTIDVRITISNFRNRLTASAITEQGAFTGGAMSVNLGDASAYRKAGKTYHGTFTGLTLPPEVEGGENERFLLNLLNGDCFVIVKSDVYPEGEARGDLRFLVSHRPRD